MHYSADRFILADDGVFGATFRSIDDGTIVEEIFEEGWLVKSSSGETLQDFTWLTGEIASGEWAELLDELREISRQLAELQAYEFACTEKPRLLVFRYKKVHKK